jgi:hypothetical protein
MKPRKREADHVALHVLADVIAVFGAVGVSAQVTAST